MPDTDLKAVFSRNDVFYKRKLYKLHDIRQLMIEISLSQWVCLVCWCKLSPYSEKDAKFFFTAVLAKNDV